MYNLENKKILSVSSSLVTEAFQHACLKTKISKSNSEVQRCGYIADVDTDNKFTKSLPNFNDTTQCEEPGFYNHDKAHTY